MINRKIEVVDARILSIEIEDDALNPRPYHYKHKIEFKEFNSEFPNTRAFEVLHHYTITINKDEIYMKSGFRAVTEAIAEDINSEMSLKVRLSLMAIDHARILFLAHGRDTVLQGHIIQPLKDLQIIELIEPGRAS